MLKISFENDCPSPDGRENPFVPGFGTKDWKDSRKQLLKTLIMFLFR
jgi:hypothetical protein